MCRYFPCHPGSDPDNFNCLFCYCPLAPIINCGGSYTVKDGIKDCSACVYPHRPENYDSIIQKLGKLLAEHKFPESGVKI